jgi:molybdopterin-guanine dinucleotide biosynthesis protein B
LLKFIEEIEPVDFVFLVGFNEPDYFNLSLENYNENINEIINLIEERSFAMIAKLNCKKCGYNTCQKFIEAKIKGLAKKEIQCLSGKDMTFLKVNDTIISMNPFVNTLIENIIFSLVESLKNDDIEMDKIKDIELKIKK